MSLADRLMWVARFAIIAATQEERNFMANDAAVLRYLADLVHGTVASDSPSGPATCARVGSADVHLTLITDSPPVLQVSCVVLSDVASSGQLLSALNHVNRSSGFVRLFHEEDAVHAVGDLLLDVLSDVAVMNLVTAVAEVADYYDDQLQDRFGGLRSSDDPRGCRACARQPAGHEIAAAAYRQRQPSVEVLA